MRKEFRIIVCCILFIPALVQSQDFSYDKQMGAQAAKQVEQMVGIYQDSALNAYVDQVGQRLAGVLGTIPIDFQFHVVDMAEPNAFALPGGYIYVSRGILSLLNDEAELAGVLGHEMIHVTKRHSVKQMKRSIFALASFAIVFLMVSTTTAVPNIKDKVQETFNDIENDNVNEQFQEKINTLDDPPAEPTFIIALALLLWYILFQIFIHWI